MLNLPIIDLLIILAYFIFLVLTALYFSVRGETPGRFVSAGGNLPSWVVGLSIFGTYLSSNTYVGVTGKAYSGNWNAFVFSLSLPVAAWIASRYFIPFYRSSGQISAYAHIESRFGIWGRIYMDSGYLLTQLARIGSIMFGVALVLNVLTGFNIVHIILFIGISVTLYTLLGGIEAVIWTDVVQSVVLTLGAILVLVYLSFDVEGGFPGILRQGIQSGKFNLGGFNLNFSESTFWVVMLYGIFINLNNFGIDQNFIQRYHTANSEMTASRSVWLAAKLYIPVSLVFFFIGTGLWVYYGEHPDKLQPLMEQFSSSGGVANQNEMMQYPEPRSMDELIGDRVFPFYMVNRVPAGLTGLLIAALFAAAMSSVDSSLNSSATIIWEDIYKRFIDHEPTEKRSLQVLRWSTLIWGILGTVTALLLIGVGSLLDAWWQLSGIFAGGMLGLFLLGIIGRSADNTAAKLSVILGLIVITWMTIPDIIPERYAYLQSPFHTHMIVVTGTLTIFLSGILISKIRQLSK